MILSRGKQNSCCCSAGVFEHFEKDGKFFAFVGQSTQAVTGMYNLNRASQVSFPGEDVLERAAAFSHEFLRRRQAEGTICDKWIIAKDLPGEVNYPVILPIDHLVLFCERN
jgi:ent-copalyl diphosphate synthase